MHKESSLIQVSGLVYPRLNKGFSGIATHRGMAELAGKRAERGARRQDTPLPVHFWWFQ